MLPTAIATDRGGAEIDGAKAVIAVTPHMEVPAVRRRVVGRSMPSFAPNQGMKSMPAVREVRTTGIPVRPVVRRSVKESFAATHTIPVWRTAFVDTCTPGFTDEGRFTVLDIPKPRRIDRGIPDIGIDDREVRIVDDVKPANITEEDRARPGSGVVGGGGEEERVLVSMFMCWIGKMVE